MSKTIQTRISNKHDLEVNWIAASKADKPFIPLVGETIIYDSEIDAQGNTLALPEGRTEPYDYSRVKVGDGFTPVHDLPFVADPANITTGLGLKATQTKTEVLIGIDDETTFIFDSGTSLDIGTIDVTESAPNINDAISVHDTSSVAHADIREEINQLSSKILTDEHINDLIDAKLAQIPNGEEVTF